MTVAVSLACAKKTYQPGDLVILQIQIKDTGIGIAQDKFAKIFEKFSRLSASHQGIYKGAGLGLYVVKGYVDVMQGSIKVDSQLGQGSCFTLDLPLTVAKQEDLEVSSVDVDVDVDVDQVPLITESLPVAETDKDTKIASEKRYNILLAEDSAAAAMAVATVLEHLKCRVDIAKDGAEVLKCVVENNYDLIFMDIGLPDIDGIEVTKRIRCFADEAKAQLPIVAVTGHAGNAERAQECLDAGMRQVLSKPAQPKVLQAVLERFCQRENK